MDSDKESQDSKAQIPKRNAIIYIRMSTEYQVQTDSNSSEMQRAACHKLCENKGLHVKKIIEQVKSGRKYREDLFNVIKNEMRSGDCIVVYSISRFARKQLHAHTLLDILKRKKCSLLSVTENMDTNNDDTTVGLYAWLAEFESRQIGARVKTALEEKRKRGEHVGAIPFGFRLSEGKGSPLEENPSEMDLLRRMRRMRTEDKMSYMKISRQLNSEGIPAPKIKDSCGWLEVTVRKLVNRDDSTICTKAKRSWYEEKEERLRETLTAQEPELSSENDSEPETVETWVSKPPEEEQTPVVSPQFSTLSPPSQISSLDGKSIVVLRAMLFKRKGEFGVEEEDIKNLSKEEILELLN